jgi:acyl-CoA thioester hydrolase
MTEGPIACPELRVAPEWIDYNGHMNMAYYHLVFDRSLDFVYDRLGIGAAYVRAEGGSCFTLEVHATYLREVGLGDPLRVTWRLLDHDAKRIHFFEEMYHANHGYLAATSEQIALHVDMQSRRSSALPAGVQGELARIAGQHRQLPLPPQVGSVIRIRR